MSHGRPPQSRTITALPGIIGSGYTLRQLRQVRKCLQCSVWTRPDRELNPALRFDIVFDFDLFQQALCNSCLIPRPLQLSFLHIPPSTAALICSMDSNLELPTAVTFHSLLSLRALRIIRLLIRFRIGGNLAVLHIQGVLFITSSGRSGDEFSSRIRSRVHGTSVEFLSGFCLVFCLTIWSLTSSCTLSNPFVDWRWHYYQRMCGHLLWCPATQRAQEMKETVRHGKGVGMEGRQDYVEGEASAADGG